MIKKIFIDNFKSLNDFTIELKPLTVMVIMQWERVLYCRQYHFWLTVQ